MSEQPKRGGDGEEWLSEHNFQPNGRCRSPIQSQKLLCSHKSTVQSHRQNERTNELVIDGAMNTPFQYGEKCDIIIIMA
jgi:hypothetical protein